MFNNLTTDGLEQTQDRIGGYSVLDTDAYLAKIKVPYVTMSSGGATAVNLIAEINGTEYRETIYITNKKGENFFLNKNDPSKKVPLPGFTVINDLCLVTTGKPLSEQDVEEKVIKVWDKDAGAELPKSVPVIVDLIGTEAILGILKEISNKNVKSGDSYVPTAETREQNIIDKVFHAESKSTVVEAMEELEPAFHDKWVTKNKGVARDKRTIKDGQAGVAGTPRPSPAMPTPNGGAAPARKPLFGAKK